MIRDYVGNKLELESRKFFMRFPSALIKSLGWTPGNVWLHVDPDKNQIIIENKRSTAPGLIGMHQNLEQLKWVKDKKKYQRELKKRISPERKEVLDSTSWDDINYDYYTIISQIKELNASESQIAQFPEELKKPYTKMISESIKYLKEVWDYLEKKGKKKPKGIKTFQEYVDDRPNYHKI